MRRLRFLRFTALRRLWRAALIAFVLTGAAAAAWLVLLPRSYTATATVAVVVQPGRASVGTTENTLAALADTRPVVRDALRSSRAHRTVARLQREVSAARVGHTALIRIKVTDTNRRVARHVADAVAAALPRYARAVVGPVTISSVERAATPSAPSRPDLRVAIPVAALAAVLAALLAALVRQTLLARVARPEEVTAATGLPVLATVRLPKDLAATPDLQPGRVTDGLRRTRVALEFAANGDPVRTLVLASVRHDDTGGWAAVSVAAALAQVDRRVLLVDADLQPGDRHPVLAVAGDGLLDVLAGLTEIEKAIVPSAILGVSVLPAGNTSLVAPQPLVERQFHPALAEVPIADFDVIVVRAPSVTGSDDAAIMAAGNALVLTVPTRTIRPAALRREARILTDRKLRILGAVLLQRR